MILNVSPVSPSQFDMKFSVLRRGFNHAIKGVTIYMSTNVVGSQILWGLISCRQSRRVNKSCA